MEEDPAESDVNTNQALPHPTCPCPEAHQTDKLLFDNGENGSREFAHLQLLLVSLERHVAMEDTRRRRVGCRCNKVTLE